MIAFEARDEIAEVVRNGGDAAGSQAADRPSCAPTTIASWGHWLLVVAGVGIFCGCVGKSAQFPLHVVVARRDGRPDARLRARALGDDGRRRRVPGRPRSIRSSRPKRCW